MSDLSSDLRETAESLAYLCPPVNIVPPTTLLLEAADTLASIREWAEKASAGYDAGNYNVTSTPQQNCGLAILRVLNRSDTNE